MEGFLLFFCPWNVLSKCPAIISQHTGAPLPLVSLFPRGKFPDEIALRAHRLLPRDFKRRNAIAVIRNAIAVIRNAIAVIRNAIAVIRNAIAVVRNAIAVIRNAIAVIRNAIAVIRNAPFNTYSSP